MTQVSVSDLLSVSKFSKVFVDMSLKFFYLGSLSLPSVQVLLVAELSGFIMFSVWCLHMSNLLLTPTLVFLRTPLLDGWGLQCSPGGPPTLCRPSQLKVT